MSTNAKLLEDFRELKSSVDSLKLEGARLVERRAFLVSRVDEILKTEQVSNVDELRQKYEQMKVDLEARTTQWKEAISAVNYELNKPA